ncbi:MAG: O-antigen/teichoic acid export membrane protein [Glaciecola sp.]|jgi:O-antigen/teichoic acid export membrane protein
MKDIILYLPSKVLPGALAIFTISLLTRTLSVEDFGRYSYFLAIGSLLTVSLFSWLTLGVNRHYLNEANEINNEIKESALFVNFIIISVSCSVLFVVIAFFNIDFVYILILLIAWLNGLFDLLQQASILEKRKVVYSISVMVRPIFLFAIALVAFFTEQVNIVHLLFVIIASYIFSCAFLYLSTWKNITPLKLHKKELTNLFHYGIPLTLNFGLMYIVSSSDKLLISTYLTEQDLGIYSASYDLFSQIVFGFGSILTLVLFPTSLKAFNQGSSYFQVTTKKNIKTAMLYLIALITMLVLCSPLLISIGLAEAYHTFANQYFTIIVTMTALYCFYSYVFIPILQLKKQVKKILFCSMIMAFTNILINIIFLEKYGIKVGIYSTLAAYVAGFAVCLFFTQQVWLGKVSKVELNHD